MSPSRSSWGQSSAYFDVTRWWPGWGRPLSLSNFLQCQVKKLIEKREYSYFFLMSFLFFLDIWIYMQENELFLLSFLHLFLFWIYSISNWYSIFDLHVLFQIGIWSFWNTYLENQYCLLSCVCNNLLWFVYMIFITSNILI